MPEKIKLSGGPPKTVTWIWLANRQLKVEYYDFSETAQIMFGNDIAYTITVNEMEKLFSAVNQNEAGILARIEQNFKSYSEIKQWLEENGIGFTIDRENWA